MAAPYTNLTYLKELAEGSNEFMVEMIQGFFEQTPEIITAMETALKRQNWKDLSAIAHKMKPTVDFMGMQSIKEAVKTLEKNAGEQNNLNTIPELVNQITRVCLLATDELKIEIKKFQ